MRLFCVYVVLFLAACHASPPVVEDFESYAVNKPIVGQGSWRETAFGRHPANIIVEVSRGTRKQLALQGSDNGDRRDLFLPEESRWRQAIAGPVIVLRLMVLPGKTGGAAEICLGRLARSNYERALTLTAHQRLVLTLPDGSAMQGLMRLEGEKWYEICLVLKLDKGNPAAATATVAFGVVTDQATQLRADPALQNIPVDLAKIPLSKWNGLEVRLDQRATIDHLRIESVADVRDLQINVSSLPDLAYQPILDRIVTPREAVSLGGVWLTARSQDAGEDSPPDAKAMWQKVLVPDQHADLFRNTQGKRVWFKRSFEVPASWQGDRVWLYLERVTDVGRVYVNGQWVGEAGQDAWHTELDMTSAVRFGAANEIAIGVLAPAEDTPINKPAGWPWYLPLFTGINYPVHMERRNAVWISDVFVQPHLQNEAALETEVAIRNDSDRPRQLRVNAVAGGEFHHTGKTLEIAAGGSATVTLRDPWPAPHLWWPHDPHLYNLDVSVADSVGGSQILDGYRQRFGFREIRVEGKRLLLNDRPFIHRRTSIIPYWNGATQRDWLVAYFNKIREQGYVGSRIHGFSSPRIFRVADEMGMLITAESAVNEPRGHQVNDGYWAAAEKDVLRMVRELRNHPSLIYWSVSNEFGSNYMPDGHPKGKEVDQWLLELGRKVMKMDPGRTVTYSGDLDLGGRGHNGPAPTLSFHYAWQPFKTDNMIPGTQYWLTQGLKPWPGIVWRQDKPLILSEDMYAEYALKPPHGMTHWAGDAAYAAGDGEDRAWFDAYRILAEGYYFAGISGWNPWGVPDRIYRFGQLMPDYLIAVKQQDLAFYSGTRPERTVHLYNELFQDLKGQLEWELWVGDKLEDRQVTSVDFPAGARKDLKVTLPLPSVQQRTSVRWHLALKAGDRVLTERDYEYSIFPPLVKIAADRSTALVADGRFAKLFDISTFGAGVHADITKALAANPKALVLAGVGVSNEDGSALAEAVYRGLRVLWLEAPEKTWLPNPLQMDVNQRSSRAFVRSAQDPLMLGIVEHDLWQWGADCLVSQRGILKPSLGSYDVLADAGGPQGLNTSPLLRLRQGQGSYLICQMLVLTQGDNAPAKALLQRLMNSVGADPSLAITRRPLMLSAKPDSALAARLKTLGIAWVPATGAPVGVLMVDGSGTLAEATIRQIQSGLQSGADVWLDQLSPEAARQISDALKISVDVDNTQVARAVQREKIPLLGGLSNGDWYWVVSGDKNAAMFSGVLRGDNEWSFPLEPAGLGLRKVGLARLLVNMTRWADPQMISLQADRAARIPVTLLHNLGVDTAGPSRGQRKWVTIKLADVANRGFYATPDMKNPPAAWFNRGTDDMRYFPINHTQLDPLNHVPAPPEAFPDQRTFAGVPFNLVDPLKNAGKSVLVMGVEGTPGQVALPLGHQADRIWMIGALDSVVSKMDPALTLQWVYRDGSRDTSVVRANMDVNGYQYFQPMERGRMAWSGDNGQRTGAVLYVWDIANPHPERFVDSIRMDVPAGRGIAIVGMTLEVQDGERYD